MSRAEGIGGARASLSGKARPGQRWWLCAEERVLDLGVLLVFLAMVLMLFEAGSRSLFGISRDWAQESVRFGIDWAFFLCLAISARRGYHIRTELFIAWLSPTWQRVCDIGAALCGLAFSALLLYGGIVQVRQLHRTGMITESNLDLPIWTVQLILPVGAALLCAFYGHALLRGLRGRAAFARSIELE